MEIIPPSDNGKARDQAAALFQYRPVEIIPQATDSGRAREAAAANVGSMSRQSRVMISSVVTLPTVAVVTGCDGLSLFSIKFPIKFLI